MSKPRTIIDMIKSLQKTIDAMKEFAKMQEKQTKAMIDSAKKNTKK